MSARLVAAFLHPPLPAIELGYVAQVLGGAYRLDFCALEPGLVASPAGLSMVAAHGLDLIGRAHTIVIPGWEPETPVPADLAAALQRAHSAGARVVTIGGGAFVAAAAGLLDGRRATTHWGCCGELSRLYPNIKVEPDRLYVDEGDVVTGAGRSAGLDLLLYLVGKDHGAAASNDLARQLVAPPWREGSQTQRAARPVPRGKDSRLSVVIDYLRSNATRPHRTPELASLAAMSPRTFNRKFRETVGHSPYRWLLHERIVVARELLELSALSIDEVSAEAGFNSTQAFRKAFRNIVGANPTDYRRTRQEETFATSKSG
jgi:AraC family transcriptional activator FtrA